ncbi:LIC12162 family protein [Flavobacteriaceae bacterium]|nr:LIC12162 family protein [Flavobacteriaceae bacterium]
MKTLQLTDIKFQRDPDFYLSEDALIFPECKSLKNKILVTSFLNDNKLITEFNKEVNKNYNLILPVLVNYLNHTHKENYSNIYWERILGFWLYSIITNYLDKHKRLVLAFEKESQIQTTSLSFSSFQTPLSTKEFLHAIRENNFFHLQQYSVILKDFYNEHVEFIDDLSYSITQDVKKTDKTQLFKSLKNKIREIFLSIIDRGYSSKVAIYVSLFSNKELFTFFWKSRFRYAPIFKDSTVKVNREIDIELRNQISGFSTKNNFADSILHNSVKFFFPIELLEGYNIISLETSKYINKNIPTSIFTGIGFSWSSQFSIWAAKCADLGTKLYGMQHGGTYGEVQILGGEALERKLTDHYITWGWNEDEKTVPLPSSRLINRQEKKTNKKSNDILWISTTDSRYNYFVGHIVFGNRFLQYFKHQQDLYSLIETKTQKKIKIRLYPNDFGWKLKERWLDKFKKIKFADNKENFILQSLKSKLVIVDHFGGTTFLELISKNIPTIIIANPDLFIFRKDAKLAYKELEEFGIVYTSNNEAAKKINEIIKNPDEWWNEEPRLAVLAKFKERYANSSSNASRVWFEFLNQTVNK